MTYLEYPNISNIWTTLGPEVFGQLRVYCIVIVLLRFCTCSNICTLCEITFHVITHCFIGKQVLSSVFTSSLFHWNGTKIGRLLPPLFQSFLHIVLLKKACVCARENRVHLMLLSSIATYIRSFDRASLTHPIQRESLIHLSIELSIAWGCTVCKVHTGNRKYSVL